MFLDHTSIWIYPIVMALIVYFSSFLIKLDFFKEVTTHEVTGRFVVLDGLRGFLALNVFFQHAITSYFYFQKGIWEIVPISFYRHLGGEAVILFFIMTSFLYWSKAIYQNGSIDAGSLYRSRFLRLAPMYIFSGVVIFLSILIQSGFKIDFFQSAKDVLSWLSLGLLTTTSVNHITILPINAGVHWTLSFEWVFYLILPILAISLRSFKTFIMATPIMFFALSSPYRGYWAIFFFGIISAHIYKKYPNINIDFKKPLYSLFPILGMVIIYFMGNKPYSFPQYFISLFVFLSFVYGADIFGLLKNKVSRFLGTISYSLYLLHGIVLFAVLNSVDYFYPISKISPMIFWILILFCGILTVIVSSITYKYIESPFIHRIRNGSKHNDLSRDVI